MDRKTFERLERQHRGENIILQLNVLEGDKKVKDYAAIIKEVQHDPVTNRVLHIDFHHISLTQEIEVKVPIVAKGEAIGVKQDGGSLDHMLWELLVTCLPTKIPQNIEVDVSHLKTHDAIHVKDLILPSEVKTKHDPEAIVLTVSPPMKEITPEEMAKEAAPTEPEVIKEKKKEEAVATPQAGAKKPAEGEAKKPQETAEKKPEGK